MSEVLERALVPGSWPTLAFVLARVGGLMLVAPLWSMSTIPGIMRTAVAVLLSVILLPTTARVALPDLIVLLPVGLAGELVIGLLIGLTAAVLVHGAALAGEVIALQMGLSLGEAFSPTPDMLVPGVGQLKTFLALLIYVAADGHLLLLRGLADSLQAIPPGTAIHLDQGPELAAGLLGGLYMAALKAAAPVMVALLCVDIAVAITSRTVPQVQAMMVLFPVTIGIGFLMLGVSLPMIATTMNGWMTELPTRVATAVHALQGAP